jgi:hypothetical protein
MINVWPMITLVHVSYTTVTMGITPYSFVLLKIFLTCSWMNNQIFYNTIYFYSIDTKKTIVNDLKKKRFWKKQKKQVL